LLLAALLLLAACKKTEPPPPAAPPPPALPALPELKPSEDFAKDGLLELPAEGPAEFGWNLAENAQHMYGYEQESHMILAVTGNKEEGKLTFRTLWKGAVKIAGGGTRGDVFFISTPTAHWVNGAAVTSEELQKITRTLAEYQLTSAGQFPSRRIGQGDEDPKLDLYFAIPSRPLKEGESETKPVHLQEPNVGSQYHGNQVIVHAGRRKVGRQAGLGRDPSRKGRQRSRPPHRRGGGLLRPQGEDRHPRGGVVRDGRGRAVRGQARRSDAQAVLGAEPDAGRLPDYDQARRQLT
jgi:hypothetical protein